MSKIKVGILFGGRSKEREISFAGGRTVYDNLNKLGMVAGFSKNYYWSSTVSNFSAWSINFGKEGAYDGTKEETLHVRAVRAF